MKRVASTYTVAAKGIGKPDYSKEVSAGKERAGIALKYNQRFRVFVGGWGITDPLYPWLLPNSIPVGGSDHLCDSDTNLPLPGPFPTIPVGRTLTMISVAFSTTQDMELYAYTDCISPELPGVCTNLGVSTGGMPIYENKIREFSTIWYDPTASLPHTLDIIAYNRGAVELHGGMALLCVEEIVGTTPFPITKDCMCPHCKHVQTVPIETTRITCEGCGKVYMVTNFASLRELGV